MNTDHSYSFIKYAVKSEMSDAICNKTRFFWQKSFGEEICYLL